MTRKRKTEARKQRKLKELNTTQKIDKKKMKQDQGGAALAEYAVILATKKSK